MNGSDALKNPDGDGFDVNKNGIIDQEEAFVNWLEYHMKSEILLQDSTHSGMEYPDNFTSTLPHHSWQGLANEAFGDRTGEYYLSLWVGLGPDPVVGVIYPPIRPIPTRMAMGCLTDGK